MGSAIGPAARAARSRASVSACSAGIGLLSGARSGRSVESAVRTPAKPTPTENERRPRSQRTAGQEVERLGRRGRRRPAPTAVDGGGKRSSARRKAIHRRSRRRQPGRRTTAAAPARVAQATAPPAGRTASAAAVDHQRRPRRRRQRRLLAPGPDPDRDRGPRGDLDRRGRCPAAAPARGGPARQVSPKAS